MNIDLSAARKAGITNLNQIETLLALRHQLLSMGDLADRLHVSTAAITTMIDRMELAGLIFRERTSMDRRIIHIRLTEHGTRIADTLLAAEPAIP